MIWLLFWSTLSGALWLPLLRLLTGHWPVHMFTTFLAVTICTAIILLMVSAIRDDWNDTDYHP